MSAIEDDFDDYLLELAGQSDNKRKRRQHSDGKSSKKRKPDVSDSGSEDERESEEDFSSDPYPLDGKFVNEADRHRLMEMSEIEREEILTQRLEEKQKLQDRRAVSQMVKEQKGVGAAGVGAGDLADSVSKAAKRQHAQRGATKEKSKKLDELKAKRKAKGDRLQNHSPKRDRSSSPMEISDEESEDGQISRLEQEEEKERRLFNQQAAPEEEPCSLMELEKCRLSRDLLAKHALSPWFEDFVKHAWVRYLIGQEGGQPVYRICEIANLAADLVKPYKINEKVMVNQAFELKHGKSVRCFNMDKVSNQPFEQKEWDRLVKVCAAEEVKLPTKQALERKMGQITKLVTQRMTEQDITLMLQRKKELQQLSHKKPAVMSTIERSRIVQLKTLAMRRQDWAEVERIEAQLATADALVASENGTDGGDASSQLSTGSGPGHAQAGGKKVNPEMDMLAKVNERNRKANMEAVRRAELAEMDRKRRERKKLAENGGVSPQVGPIDPSARLKTKPRMFNAVSRSGTPNNGSANGTPVVQATGTAGSNVPSRPISPLTLAGADTPTPDAIGQSFEASIIEGIEVDLGDF